MSDDIWRYEDPQPTAQEIEDSHKIMLLCLCRMELGLEGRLRGSFTHEDAQRLRDVILEDSELVKHLRKRLNININEDYMPTRLVNLLFSKLLGVKARPIGRSRKEGRIQRYGFDPVEADRPFRGCA